MKNDFEDKLVVEQFINKAKNFLNKVSSDGDMIKVKSVLKEIGNILPIDVDKFTRILKDAKVKEEGEKMEH